MKCNMITLPVDADRAVTEIEFKGSKPTYDELRALLNRFPELSRPNHYEHVTVLYEDRRCDMFVDEDGVRKGLPINPSATTIYRHNWMTQHPHDNPDELPAVYGLAVLFDRQVWF